MGDISIKGKSPILRQGFAQGGRAKAAVNTFLESAGGSEKGKPHSTKEGRIASGTRRIRRLLAGKGRPKAGPQAPSRPLPKWKNMPWNPKEKPKWKNMPRNPNEKPKWQAMEMKKGGKADKKWIQKATASIKKRGTKGKCTPITKPGCTGRAKALAKTFKKMAKKRKAA